MAIILKNSNEIKLMRKSGRLAQHILNSLAAEAHAGATPRQLDAVARKMLEGAGARSPFLGYRGYPATITVSVNDAIVHGIPTDTPFVEGDIVSLDVGAILNGFVGDTAGTFPVGQISERAQRLMRVTREALRLGIEAAVVGNRTGDIGWVIQNHVESHGYTVVKALVGHGVGRSMHEDPQVPNHGKPGTGVKLKPGMTFAIEPMVNEGTDDVRQLDDKWTYVTADGKLSAHYEHTIAVLSDGPEILTKDD